MALPGTSKAVYPLSPGMDRWKRISIWASGRCSTYPTTYLYRKDSFFYDTIYADFQQTRNLASLSINLDNRKTEAELVQFLTTLGCDCNTLPLSLLRKNAETFNTNFRKDLKAAN